MQFLSPLSLCLVRFWNFSRSWIFFLVFKNLSRVRVRLDLEVSNTMQWLALPNSWGVCEFRSSESVRSWSQSSILISQISIKYFECCTLHIFSVDCKRYAGVLLKWVEQREHSLLRRECSFSFHTPSSGNNNELSLINGPTLLSLVLVYFYRGPTETLTTIESRLASALSKAATLHKDETKLAVIRERM